ncbi:nuclear transport factor 2 family protein [Lyngbya sp. CCY1209]|jgi:ketosteroid isomerase-like protein|uniref:nuclear transport factor 2 family protein n=1 Tax=Lyngbya sp. CCY1209 TaxID=2886103 RepID=UPI002D21293D|nr:nuclear transport factor 2 family protein [Lyngbya sp. CCY1209]MEB3885531.1 nuclear transport factor 2 family protein [Lyngbya sp. CCY1209]
MTDRQALIAANKAFYRAFEKKDIEAMSAVWSRGTSSLCIHPGREALKGWDAIERSWQQIFKGTQYLEINIEIISTDICGEIAYIVAIENVMQIVGRRRVRAESMATNIFQLMGDRWYLIHHHGSPLMRR